MTPEELDRLKYDLSYKLGLWSNSKHEQQLREFVYQLITHIDAQAVQISDLTAKYEDQIAGLQICIRIRDVRNYELVAQIAALRRRDVEECRAYLAAHPGATARDVALELHYSDAAARRIMRAASQLQ